MVLLYDIIGLSFSVGILFGIDMVLIFRYVLKESNRLRAKKRSFLCEKCQKIMKGLNY